MERSRGWCRGFGWHKKQGRRRSITLTALPAPDIEIGLRHPVNYSLARNRADECDPFHSRYKNCGQLATAKIAKVIRVRRWLLKLRSLFMDNASQDRN